jgi:hypothetical protein
VHDEDAVVVGDGPAAAHLLYMLAMKQGDWKTRDRTNLERC